MQFLPSSGCVDTAIWLHYMDANSTNGEKAWRQLHKNAVSNFEQVLEATHHKSAAILPPTMKTIRIRQTRHAWHCGRSRDKLISDVLLWTPSHGQAKAGWPARTYMITEKYVPICVFVYNIFLPFWTYFHCKLVAFLFEHVRVFALNIVHSDIMQAKEILIFSQKKLLKNWTNSKFSCNKV